MIERYSRPEMAEIFSESGKYARWLESSSRSARSMQNEV